MFKIESYITSIILNHVAKYVKNIRPQDAQVSLWEGEVAFQNLDLRLDVLEEELQLPFEFLSGHIHELIIHVPWTKIASEPITITINTIEFVLKLKDGNADTSPKAEKRKKISKVDDTQLGYMPGLVNKVANNIIINCHNIILKYVEEDIVVSMNVQLLSFSSADENWRPSFIEISPTKVLLRKLIQVSDLTICLDKRNAAGQIDVCQEPILYRCTLEMRILRKYNVATASISSVTRIDIFTNSMDINVSSQQFPMVMRLMILLMTLKDGKLKLKINNDSSSDHGQEAEQIRDTNESYFSWAWNLLPSIFPDDFELEETDIDNGHLLSTGCYIEKLKLTLKSSELFADSIVQATRKIRYNPILRISMGGIFCETHIVGRKWSNLKAGVSEVSIEPLGTFSIASKTQFDYFLISHNKAETAYIENSFFDVTVGELSGDTMKHNVDWDTHLNTVTEAHLQYRGPALAFDMLHHIDIPDDSQESELGSDLEFSDVSEKILTRVFLSSFTAKINSTLLSIIDTVKLLINSYDYPPYIEEKAETGIVKLSPPSTDDYDALMEDIPIRVYELSISNCFIELHARLEEVINARSSSEQIILRKSKRKQLPFFLYEIKHLQVVQTLPIYPKRLIHTTCQLPIKPQKLLDACYSRSDVNLKSLSAYVATETDKLLLFSVPLASFGYNTILEEHLWLDENIVKTKIEVYIQNIMLVTNRPQQLTAHRILKASQRFSNKTVNALLRSNARRDMCNKYLPKFELEVANVHFNVLIFEHTSLYRGNLKSIYAHIIEPRSNEHCNMEDIKRYTLFSAPGYHHTSHGETKFCQGIVQMPNQFSDIIHPPVVAIKLEPSTFIFQPILTTFLQYEDDETDETPEKELSPTDGSTYGGSETKSSKVSYLSDRQSKKIAPPEETVHLSSDKAEKIDLASLEESTNVTDIFNIINLFSVAKLLIVNVEINQCSILVPTHQIVTDTLKGIKDNNITTIKLPIITCKSSPSQDIENFNVEYPLRFLETIWTQNKDTFPWTCSLLELQLSTKISGIEELFLSPGKTNITVAVNYKKDNVDNENIALNFHIDTSPILMYISEEQFLGIKESFEILVEVLKLISPIYENSRERKYEKPRIVTTPEDDCNIKEFLGMNSNSEMSTEVPQQKKGVSEKRSIATWLQWTVTKLTIHIRGCNKPQSQKLCIEIEDFITSIDKQDVYFKLKSKIGTLNGEHLTRNSRGDWISDESLKLAVRTEATNETKNDTFLDLTVTIAETGNVFEKWGATKKNRNLNHSLTEVMINAQAIDLRFDLDLFGEYLPIFYAMGLTDQNSNTITTVEDLPLVYFDCKGFVLYIPTKTDKFNCDVLIVKVGKIKISPNVENPLSRVPVRPDVFTKAAQLRILNTPGSKVEDRQYEILFDDISAVTSSWTEIVSYIKENSGSFHNTNPAFEWNHQSKKSPLMFNQIFNKFVVSITYAPCIVYKMILICGQSIEINCVSDLVADINTDQIILLSRIYEIVAKLQSFSVANSQKNEKFMRRNSLLRKMSSNSIVIRTKTKKSSNSSTIIRPSTKFTTILKINKSNRGDRISALANISKISSEKICTDSGIASLDRNHKRKESNFQNSHSIQDDQNIPFEISFIAGIFLVRLFHPQENKTEVVEDTEELMLPLIAVTITQPSMLISQKIYERIFKLSVFNMNINFGWSPDDNQQNANEFSDVLFETRQGHLDSAGIPPPLISMRVKETITKKIEIDCKISRPIKIFLSHKTMDKLLKIRILLNEFFIVQYNRTRKALKPIFKSSKIELIKNMFYNADRFVLAVDQTNIECKRVHHYDIKISIGKFTTTLDIAKHPEKLIFQSYIESFLISTERRIMCHPTSFNLNGELIQESWHRFPIVLCNIKSDVIQIDIGPENLQNILKFNENITECIESFVKHLEILEGNELNLSSSTEDLDEFKKRDQVILPPVITNDFVPPNEEFYQDDLRAGAFQFIETKDEFPYPLPYQIQIILKDNGIVCWRYPQPRNICKMQVFPVPIQTSSPIRIQCRLEYFSEPHSSFLPYCQFHLCENETQIIILPNKKITAHMWRVVILQSLISVDRRYFEESTSSDDEDELNALQIQKLKIEDLLDNCKMENDFRLSPKALVACMRIDSSFNPKFIPQFQALCDIAMIKINLQNQYKPKKYTLPNSLKEFKLTSDIIHTQTFLSLVLSNIKLYSNMLASKEFSISCNLAFYVQSIDYSFLNMIFIIEETDLSFLADSSEELNINIVLDTFKLNIGPAILQALMTSYLIWQKVLKGNNETEILVMTRFVICNTTNVQFHFGQVNTNELILLKPKDCCLYTFRSDHMKQELVFMQETGLKSSDPVAIGKEGLKYLRIDDTVLLVHIEKLSSSQVCVFLKGQIEFLSMSKSCFRLQCRPCNHQDKTKPQSDILLEKEGNVTYFLNCSKDEELCIRIKMHGDNRKGWSGEVPLKIATKNVPWLVKVPVVDKQEFKSFWVRVMRENISDFQNNDFKPQRILVVIWPMFFVRSRLPIPIKLTMNKKSLELIAKGRAEVHELEIAGTHETEHEIFLQKELFSRDEQNKAILSYKTIDWNKFFFIDDKFCKIESALKELKKPINVKWPYDEEMSCCYESMPELINPVYKCFPSRELSCSLMMDISPPYLFINSTNFTINILDAGDTIGSIIEPNKISMPNFKNNTFRIAINVGHNKWISSKPILSRQNLTYKNSKQDIYTIEDIGSAVIEIETPTTFWKLILYSTNENGIRIFKLTSVYVVSNLSIRPVIIIPFLVYDNLKLDRSQIEQERNSFALPNLTGNFKSCSRASGWCLDSFSVMEDSKAQSSGQKSLNFFMCIRCDEKSEYSCPITLNKSTGRKCFSISHGNTSIPLAVSICENKGQYYINIYDDPCPILELNNQTDLTLFVAQCNSADHTKTISVAPECDSRFIEWYQIIRPRRQVFYSPPTTYATYPEVETYKCNIAFGLVYDFKNSKMFMNQNIKWSKPLQIKASKEQFLNIPFQGDIKIIICDKHKTTKVFIYYVAQQMEFCVKDLRTRLLYPNASDLELEDSSMFSKSLKNIELEKNTNINRRISEESINSRECSNHAIKKPIINLNCFVKEFILSISIDCKDKYCLKTPIFALYMDDLYLEYNNKIHTMEALLSNLQLDNQLYSTGGYDFPVILCPKDLYKKNSWLPSPQCMPEDFAQKKENCSAYFKINFYNTDFEIESIVVKFSPMRAYIEDTYFNDLLDNMVDWDIDNMIFVSHRPLPAIICKPGQVVIPKELTAQVMNLSEPLKLKHIKIESLSVMLSVHTCVRLYLALDHSPLDFSTYEREHLITVPLRFGHSLGMHYLSGALFGAGWVVGSLEILGSPSGLARSLTTGLRDFVSMPVQGLLRGPWGFIIGITQGSASLLRNITAGTVNSVTKLAASVARNLDRLTLDDEHFQRTEVLRRSRPQGFTEGLTQGLTGLGISLLGAVGGLARHPLEARSPVEVVTGVGKGIVGAFAKPISGAAELVALTGQGVLHTVGFNAMPQQRISASTRNVAIYPAECKLLWKLLPGILSTDQVLFYYEATLILGEMLKRVLICLTPTIFAVLDLEKDELSEIIAVERVEASFDSDDDTVINIKVLSANDAIEETESQFIKARILSFLRGSNDHLSPYSLQDLLDKKMPNESSSKYELHWSFYMSQYMGRHLLRYLSLVKGSSGKI